MYIYIYTFIRLHIYSLPWPVAGRPGQVAGWTGWQDALPAGKGGKPVRSHPPLAAVAIVGATPLRSVAPPY